VVFRKGSKEEVDKGFTDEPGDKECQELLKVGRDFLKTGQPGRERMVSFNSIPSDGFFLVTDDRALSDREACSLESALRLLRGKHVYIIQLLCRRERQTDNEEGQNFILLLKSLYKDLIPLRVEGDEYFEGTPLQGLWECEDRTALLGAALLTLWRFGGAYMSTDIVLANKELLESRGLTHVSTDLIVSRSKCDGFPYVGLKVVAEALKKPSGQILDKLMKTSVREYCKERPSQCDRIKPIPEEAACRGGGKHFLRTEALWTTPTAWIDRMTPYCKQIVKTYLQRKASQQEVRYEQAQYFW
jgi:hypothetical protein